MKTKNDDSLEEALAEMVRRLPNTTISGLADKMGIPRSTFRDCVRRGCPFDPEAEGPEQIRQAKSWLKKHRRR